MKNNNWTTIFLTVPFLFALVLVLSSVFSKEVLSAASHVVISEIQTGGATADDEFIELYNPTENSVVLDGWRLTRKTSGGSQTNLVANISGTIQSHGFFLVANPSYVGGVSPDLFYSATSSAIANNNTVLLYSDAGVTVVDKVGLGTATDVEGASTTNPVTSGSVERKAQASSTTSSMGVGGSDQLLGNGEDTDNNLSDFVTREVSNPQNSSSQTETLSSSTPLPTSTGTPFPTSTAIPTATPTSTPTSAPTLAPTPTPTVIPTTTPTSAPTSTPVITPTATPTATPTPSSAPTGTPQPMPTGTPNVTPTPSATPTSTPQPTIAPSVTPSPTPGGFRSIRVECKVTYKEIRTMFFVMKLPIISCSVVRI